MESIIVFMEKIKFEKLSGGGVKIVELKLDELKLLNPSAPGFGSFCNRMVTTSFIEMMSNSQIPEYTTLSHDQAKYMNMFSADTSLLLWDFLLLYVTGINATNFEK